MFVNHMSILKNFYCSDALVGQYSFISIRKVPGAVLKYILEQKPIRITVLTHCQMNEN